MAAFPGRIDEEQTRPPIKEKERKLIYALVEDSRQPLTAIAKRLRISKDSAHYLFEKLQDDGVIAHLSPLVDLECFGYHTYHAFFVINDANKQRRDAFLDALCAHPHTKGVMEYSDRWEAKWTLVARTVQEFDTILMRLTTDYSDVITEKTKLAVIQGYKSTTLAERTTREHKTRKTCDVDAQDAALLDALHTDGRASSYALAKQLDLSANTIRYRLKNLEEANVIRGYSATINLNALGYHLYTVGVIFKSLSQQQEAKLKTFLAQERFVIRAVKVLGHWDLLLTILADNVKHFHRTIKAFDDTFSDIIVNYEALIAYRERIYKYVPDVVLTSFK